MSGGYLAATYFWCIHCEHVYPAIWWIDYGRMCPNPTCDGTLDDAWAWGETLLSDHPDWPEVPDPGEHYPL